MIRWLLWIVLPLWASEPFTVWKYREFTKWQQLLFDFERESGFVPADGAVWAPGCNPQEERKLGTYSLSPTVPIRRGMTREVGFHPEAPTAYIKDYFKLFRETEVGAELTRQFQPLYEGGRVPVLFFSQEKKAQMPGAEAICECEPGNKRIYVNKFAKSGLMAAALGHEMVHALDPELERAKLSRVQMVKDLFTRFREQLDEASRRTGRRVESLFLKDVDVRALTPLFLRRHQVDQFVQLTHYRAERRAALFENRLLEELRTLMPTFYSKYKLAPAPSSQSIVSEYGFKRQYIERYLSGKCAVPQGF